MYYYNIDAVLSQSTLAGSIASDRNPVAIPVPAMQWDPELPKLPYSLLISRPRISLPAVQASTFGINDQKGIVQRDDFFHIFFL